MAKFDLRSDLLQALKGLDWRVRGIMVEDKLLPLPPESRIVTVILQSLAVGHLAIWAKRTGITLDEFPDETRGYPDMALSGGPIGTRLIALDIKSARYSGDDDVSRMTLGTYDGYFLHANEKRLHGGMRSYNDYDEHWVIGLIYEWRPKEDTLKMVRIVDVIVGEKWQVASKSSGSGDTANMGGIDSLSKLRTLKSEFSSEEEYALKHPRKRTRAPANTIQAKVAE